MRGGRGGGGARGGKWFVGRVGVSEIQQGWSS